MTDRLTYKLVDAKELFNYPNGDGHEWVDANRFDYKQEDHTRCRKIEDARKVGVYDIIFYLDNKQCVGAPFTLDFEEIGCHPDKGEGLSVQRPSLKKLAPRVSELITKLTPEDHYLLLNIDKDIDADNEIPTGKQVTEIDYFWIPNRNIFYAHTGAAHQKSFAFPCSKEELPIMVNRYWTRFTSGLCPNHFSAYVVPGNEEDAQKLMNGMIDVVNSTKKNRQATAREFIEENSFLAIDNNEYGWGIRITTKKADKSNLTKLLG